jgi:hypothetical protein
VTITSITYDRKLDAAGSMDDEYETYDLCYICYNRVLKQTIYEIGSELGLTLYEVGECIIDNIKFKL